MSKEAMKLALDALEMIDRDDNDRDFLFPSQCYQLDEAITALREALAEQPAQQEPVSFEAFNAWMHHNLPVGTVIGHSGWWADKIYSRFIKHTSPPAQRTWVGLTDKDIDYLCELAYENDEELILTVQAKLKEKNT